MTMNNDEHSTEDDDERSMSPSVSNSQAEKQRKISHSEIERRRREKMNRYIDEIAQLLPIDAVKKLDKLTVLRVAVDTIKQLKGASSSVSGTGFGKQTYLTDNELFELTLATIDQLGTFFFLLVECEKGRICYASTSVESTLGYKPVELCSQNFFDLVHPHDLDVVRQQFFHERTPSATTHDDSSNDGKCLSRLNPKRTCLQIGRRRTFSSRIRTKTKRTFAFPAGTTTASNQFCAVDFVGYLKDYSLTADPSTPERRRGSLQSFSSADVFRAIGTNPTTCLLTMGSLAKRLDLQSDPSQCLERMFLWKLNADGQFTYFDQISFSLLGYLSHELLGLNFIDFVHEDDRSKLIDIWLRVCRDRQIVTSGFYRFRSKDNVYLTFQTIFEPFLHPWNDDLEIIVARNKIKSRSTRMSVSTNETPQSVDIQTPNLMDSSELIQNLLP